MAGENNTGLITEGAETDTTAKMPAPKKQRAPRRQKAVAEKAAGSLAATATFPKTRRKRGEQAAEAKVKAKEAQVTDKSAKNDAIKDVGRKRTPKQTEQTAKAPFPAVNEMAELIQLEEENKRLRKALANKLRTENADLRKRLGLD